MKLIGVEHWKRITQKIVFLIQTKKIESYRLLTWRKFSAKKTASNVYINCQSGKEMKKLLLTVTIILCLSSFNSQTVSANGVSLFDLGELASMAAIGQIDKAIQSEGPAIKSGSAYNESDDPLLRRGTQNTDSPQNVFFAIPVALTVIFFIVLLMRKK